MLFLPWVASTQAVRNDLSRSLLTCILILYRVIWYLSYIDILVYTWWIVILYIFMLNKFCLSPESWANISLLLCFTYHWYVTLPEITNFMEPIYTAWVFHYHISTMHSYLHSWGIKYASHVNAVFGQYCRLIMFNTLKQRQNDQLPIYRQYFQIHIPKWKCLDFGLNFIEMCCSQGSNWQ